MVRAERERRLEGETTAAVAYAIPSPGRGRAGAARLGGRIRPPRGIENRRHDVRGVTFGEDARRVRTGSSPQVLAALRNAAHDRPEGVDAPGTAAAMRRFAAPPREAARLVLNG